MRSPVAKCLTSVLCCGSDMDGGTPEPVSTTPRPTFCPFSRGVVGSAVAIAAPVRSRLWRLTERVIPAASIEGSGSVFRVIG
jgi:hypothetical protein